MVCLLILRHRTNIKLPFSTLTKQVKISFVLITKIFCFGYQTSLDLVNYSPLLLTPRLYN